MPSTPATKTKPCPCNSGRHYKRCCGKRSRSKNDKRRTDQQIYPLYQDACLAHHGQRYTHCISAVKEILNREPFHYGALNLFFSTPNQLNFFNSKELKAIAKNALAGFPSDLDMRCNAAEVYIILDLQKQAIDIFAKVIEKEAHHFRAHFGMGRITTQRQQLDIAEYHLRQASYIRQFAPQVLCELANVLSALGRKDEAEHYYRVSLSQAPDNVNALISWSKMEESRNKIDRAWDLYRYAQSQAKDTGHVQLVIHEALLHRRKKNYKQALSELDQIEDNLSPSNRAAYWFEKSNTLDKMGLFDLAFKAAENANNARRDLQNLRYDSDKQQKASSALKSFFRKSKVASLKPAQAAHENEEQPIFICGFTRSGTSMIEQILSAHSKICGGDELPYIYDLADSAQRITQSEHQYPECLAEQNVNGSKSSAAQVLRQHYLNRFRLTSVLEPGVRSFTDKMPMNEMHMGLIHTLFPQSKIIHVFRHPLDSVLSTYFTDATHGSHCSYDIKTTAEHYRALFDLSEHYLKNLNINYHRIRYEDTVADINIEANKVLSFLGLEFEQNCIDFHTNPRYARTASYAQVKQPLYTSSLARHRNYVQNLKPVIPILEPVIEALGYSI